MLEENAKYLMLNMMDKITGIIALTNWHKNFLINYYGLDPNKIFIIGNGLAQENFNKKVDKIKNRFIYTSAPNRGLDKLIEYMLEIRKTVPDVTLYIYRGLDDFDNNTKPILDKIKKYPYKDFVKFMGKVDQETLAVEMLKSEYWFYPTNFTETYCMSGLEAMAAGCMCITSDLAALHDTIGDRGILIKNSNRYSEEYKKH